MQTDGFTRSRLQELGESCLGKASSCASGLPKADLRTTTSCSQDASCSHSCSTRKYVDTHIYSSIPSAATHSACPPPHIRVFGILGSEDLCRLMHNKLQTPSLQYLFLCGIRLVQK